RPELQPTVRSHPRGDCCHARPHQTVSHSPPPQTGCFSLLHPCPASPIRDPSLPFPSHAHPMITLCIPPPLTRVLLLSSCHSPVRALPGTPDSQ
ncbi:unnamed protein product, partial [Closterium sp. NIES-54]